MDPLVIAAWVAAGASVATLAGTTISDHFNRVATRKDNDNTLNQQREQLKQTLTEQRSELDNTLTAQGEHLQTTLRAQSEQLDRTLAQQRAQTLNERFATAAGQLGNGKPPAVRLAGVYAMAGLADDWEENRQTCVEVLCGY